MVVTTVSLAIMRLDEVKLTSLFVRHNKQGLAHLHKVLLDKINFPYLLSKMDLFTRRNRPQSNKIFHLWRWIYNPKVSILQRDDPGHLKEWWFNLYFDVHLSLVASVLSTWINTYKLLAYYDQYIYLICLTCCLKCVCNLMQNFVISYLFSINELWFFSVL